MICRRFLALAALSTLATLAMASLACGGGGGGGGGGGPVTPPPPSLVFTPTGGGGANSVTLASGPGSNATTLVLEVRANQVDTLYGVAFDLRFPSTLLRYESVEEGTFLNSAGNSPTSLLVAPEGDTLVVGHARLGAAGDAGGSGVLMTLRFTAIAAGSGAFTFSRTNAVSSNGVAQPITFSGGTVQVTL